MFRGLKPTSQPRSLRSITERKTAASGFPAPVELKEAGWDKAYQDGAKSVLPKSGANTRPTTIPHPFK